MNEVRPFPIKQPHKEDQRRDDGEYRTDQTQSSMCKPRSNEPAQNNWSTERGMHANSVRIQPQTDCVPDRPLRDASKSCGKRHEHPIRATNVDVVPVDVEDVRTLTEGLNLSNDAIHELLARELTGEVDEAECRRDRPVVLDSNAQILNIRDVVLALHGHLGTDINVEPNRGQSNPAQ